MKMNCWECMGCGRHIQNDKGICPATVDARLDGIYGGKNAGRACWLVKDTLCGGRSDGKFKDKIKKCSNCGFYNRVMKEEGKGFIISINALKEVWMQK